MSTNSIIANMNALSLDEEQKKQREKYKADMQADIDANGASWDSQINSTQKYYDKQIGDTKIAYDTEYQKNAVQKLINEKKIAETNANLGLTDSGLNRTQQTAAQLSYANQKGKIDLARQSALDNLTLAMTDAITTLQNQKVASARDITKQWNDYADTQAQNIYNTKYNGYVDMHNAQVEADAAVQKAAIEAATNNKPLLYDWKGETVLDGNGNSLLKFTGNDGENYNVTPGKNPYTNAYNAKISDIVDGKCIIDKEWQKKNKNSDNEITRACAKYGVFGNGYQPKGICVFVDGEWKDSKLHALTDDKGKIVKASDTGKEQTIWKDDSDKLYIWRGDLNRYKEVVI